MTAQAEPKWLGSEEGYEWLVATCSLGDLLRVCPEIAIGRFVAVTAFDSGRLVLTEEQKASGWDSRFGIAYSPKVADPKVVPHDSCCCYNEWYLFDERTEIGRIAEQDSSVFEPRQREDTIFQFVNYHLGLHCEEQRALAELFWKQIRRIQPEIYVADCQDFVTVVSDNKELFAAARRGVEALSAADMGE